MGRSLSSRHKQTTPKGSVPPRGDSVMMMLFHQEVIFIVDVVFACCNKVCRIDGQEG
jgi:hypothetical protein